MVDRQNYHKLLKTQTRIFMILVMIGKEVWNYAVSRSTVTVTDVVFWFSTAK